MQMQLLKHNDVVNEHWANSARQLHGCMQTHIEATHTKLKTIEHADSLAWKQLNDRLQLVEVAYSQGVDGAASASPTPCLVRPAIDAQSIV
jgi:hypothetical protein